MVQGVGVDKSRGRGDSLLVDLGSAIKSALHGRTQQWLADAVGIDKSAVTRIIAGQMKDLTLTRVIEIEDALEVPRGALLRAAGYVAEVATPEDAIASDTTLPVVARDLLLAAVASQRAT